MYSNEIQSFIFTMDNEIYRKQPLIFTREEW